MIGPFHTLLCYAAVTLSHTAQVSQDTQRLQWLSFHEAMLNSEFCLPPLGGNGGPTGACKRGSGRREVA